MKINLDGVAMNKLSFCWEILGYKFPFRMRKPSHFPDLKVAFDSVGRANLWRCLRWKARQRNSLHLTLYEKLKLSPCLRRYFIRVAHENWWSSGISFSTSYFHSCRSGDNGYRYILTTENGDIGVYLENDVVLFSVNRTKLCSIVRKAVRLCLIRTLRFLNIERCCSTGLARIRTLFL